MKRENLAEENARLRRWVADLLSDMYVNCVYCGHRYGPAKDTPVAMADVLKRHIETCPQHPLSELKAELKRLRARRRRPPLIRRYFAGASEEEKARILKEIGECSDKGTKG